MGWGVKNCTFGDVNLNKEPNIRLRSMLALHPGMSGFDVPASCNEVSCCDNEPSVQRGLLADPVFGDACVFTNVLNCIDSDSRKAMESAEGRARLPTLPRVALPQGG